MVAGLAAGFAVAYLRHAVTLPWHNGGQPKGWSRIVLEGFFYFRDLPDCIKLIHALLAACLVGMLTHTSIVHTKNNMIDGAKSSLDLVLQSFDQSQGWLGRTAVATDASQRGRLQPKDLIKISCELRDMYAAIHVFDVGDQYFQLSPDFRVSGDSGRDEARTPDCKALRAKDTTIGQQMVQLREICGALNRVELLNASPQGAPNSAPSAGPNQSQRAGPRMIVPTLFKIPERCEPNSLDSQNPDEKDFLGLGNSLFGLFINLDSFNSFSTGDGSHAVVVFPMITAFLIAYTFGAGCRIWRAWWLNNEAGQQEMDKLKEQIGNLYGQPVQSAAFEQWLISPLNVLNNVAPKEAVRYEGLKVRLYAKIEGRQIDLGNVVASPGTKFTLPSPPATS